MYTKSWKYREYGSILHMEKYKNVCTTSSNTNSDLWRFPKVLTLLKRLLKTHWSWFFSSYVCRCSSHSFRQEYFEAAPNISATSQELLCWMKCACARLHKSQVTSWTRPLVTAVTVPTLEKATHKSAGRFIHTYTKAPWCSSAHSLWASAAGPCSETNNCYTKKTPIRFCFPAHTLSSCGVLSALNSGGELQSGHLKSMCTDKCVCAVATLWLCVPAALISINASSLLLL